ncbi:MAG: hypothetical protein AABY87_04555 [bacterium]|mgnify:CR=1 FL=1
MGTKQLLYVMQSDENLEEGLSYAIGLAKMMNKGITVLLLYKKKLQKKFEDVMMAVTFAEANEHETAREMITESLKNGDDAHDARIDDLMKKCKTSGVNVDIYEAALDAMTAVRNFLKQKTFIDLVLLSPGVTNSGKMTKGVLDRFVKLALRPVVTMTKGT